MKRLLVMFISCWSMLLQADELFLILNKHIGKTTDYVVYEDEFKNAYHLKLLIGGNPNYPIFLIPLFSLYQHKLNHYLLLEQEDEYYFDQLDNCYCIQQRHDGQFELILAKSGEE